MEHILEILRSNWHAYAAAFAPLSVLFFPGTISTGSNIVASDFGVSGGSVTVGSGATTTIAHGLGKTPKLVHLMYLNASGSGSTDDWVAYGIYVGGAAYSVSTYVDDNVSGAGAASVSNTFSCSGVTGTITANSTNIVVTWGGGAGPGVGYLIWDAQLGA